MGIEIRDLNQVSIGGVRFATGQLDFDSSYPTGGATLVVTQDSFALPQLRLVQYHLIRLAHRQEAILHQHSLAMRHP